MKKTLLALSCAAAVGAAVAPAQAAFVSTDIYTPGGATLLGNDVYTIDYNAQGVAVAQGAGPFGTYVPAVGTEFNLRVMTTVVGFTKQNGSSAVTAAGSTDLFLDGSPHEITAVASMRERVIISSANSATFVILPVGTVSLYYGAANANYSTGAGFDDGTLIYRADVVGGTSGFQVSGPDTGLGSVNINGHSTVIDPTVFADLALDLTFSFVNPEGQTGYPQPTTFPGDFFLGGDGVLYPTYTVTFCAPTSAGGSCDLPLRFDGSSRFEEVPEPGTLALVGLSLAGAGWARRRKSA